MHIESHCPGKDGGQGARRDVRIDQNVENKLFHWSGADMG